VYNFIVDWIRGQAAYVTMSLGRFPGTGESCRLFPYRALIYDDKLPAMLFISTRTGLPNLLDTARPRIHPCPTVMA
jgi:hypothetical protein